MILFLDSFVRRLLKKRPAKKESARLPVSFMRACARVRGATRTIGAFLDITWATACVADVACDIELASLYKYRGLPKSQAASFRGVGLAPGLLAMISDALHMRCAPFYAAASAGFQLGGNRDGRFQIITANETTCKRRAMGLPTVDLLADAKGGYDGGRHGQLLRAAKQASIRPQEWL